MAHASELVILRVPISAGVATDHHVRMSRRAGLGDADRARVAEGPHGAGWSPRERILLTAVDELHGQQDIRDTTWNELRRYLGDRDCIELCMLVGHYETLATTITALRIPDDRAPHQSG